MKRYLQFSIREKNEIKGPSNKIKDSTYITIEEIKNIFKTNQIQCSRSDIYYESRIENSTSVYNNDDIFISKIVRDTGYAVNSDLTDDDINLLNQMALLLKDKLNDYLSSYYLLKVGDEKEIDLSSSDFLLEFELEDVNSKCINYVNDYEQYQIKELRDLIFSLFFQTEDPNEITINYYESNKFTHSGNIMLISDTKFLKIKPIALYYSSNVSSTVIGKLCKTKQIKQMLKQLDNKFEYNKKLLYCDNQSSLFQITYKDIFNQKNNKTIISKERINEVEDKQEINYELKLHFNFKERNVFAYINNLNLDDLFIGIQNDNEINQQMNKIINSLYSSIQIEHLRYTPTIIFNGNVAINFNLYKLFFKAYRNKFNNRTIVTLSYRELSTIWKKENINNAYIKYQEFLSKLNIILLNNALYIDYGVEDEILSFEQIKELPHYELFKKFEESKLFIYGIGGNNSDLDFNKNISLERNAIKKYDLINDTKDFLNMIAEKTDIQTIILSPSKWPYDIECSHFINIHSCFDFKTKRRKLLPTLTDKNGNSNLLSFNFFSFQIQNIAASEEFDYAEVSLQDYENNMASLFNPLTLKLKYEKLYVSIKDFMYRCFLLLDNKMYELYNNVIIRQLNDEDKNKIIETSKQHIKWVKENTLSISEEMFEEWQQEDGKTLDEKRRIEKKKKTKGKIIQKFYNANLKNK